MCFLTYSYIIDYQPIDKRFNKKVIFCSKIFPKNVCISKFCCNFAVFLKHNNIVLLFLKLNENEKVSFITCCCI